MTTQNPMGRRIALAAMLIAVGSITSRLIGVIREAVFAATFGRGNELAAFTAAATIPTLVYDLLLSGALSAALVPVFSRVVQQPEVRDALVSRVLSLMIVVVSGIILPLLWLAPQVVQLLAGGFDANLQELTTTMVRWMLFAVPCMVVAGVMTAVLQAQQQFVLPAFATSIFNIGIIIAAVILAPWLGPIALAIGMVLGAALQVALQYYGLRHSKLTWRTDWSDPSIREMLRLYAPVALGMGFSAIGTLIDRRYATDFGAQVLPTMRYATTLIQFPLGLVAAAVSTAILPSLARLSDNKSLEQFRSTVGTALTVVIALIVPASVVLWLIRMPLTALILQRQAFSVADTQAVANTLMYYIPGLPAAAIDQILLFACYARGRTLAPNLVQGGAIIAYVLGVWLVMPWLGHSAETLAMANSIQWIAHMLLMALLCQQQFDLRGLAVGQTLVLCVMAAAVTWVTVQAVMTVVVISQVFIQVIVIAGLTGVIYLVVAWLLGITPVLFAADLIRQRLIAVIMRLRPTPP